MTKTSLGCTLNLLAKELSIVTSLCPSSRILKPVGDSKMLQLHFEILTCPCLRYRRRPRILRSLMTSKTATLG